MFDDTKPGTRVVCLTANGTQTYGEGTYLGRFPRPWWQHPASIALCARAVTKFDGKPLLQDEDAHYTRMISEGRMTVEQVAAQKAAASRYTKLETGRPVRDRAWQHAASTGLNPKIALDSGGHVWGCECWWGTVDDAPPEKLAKIAAMQQVPAPARVGQPNGPADFWMIVGHPDLEHLEAEQGQDITLEDRPVSAALFSPCRKYRYALARTWGTGPYMVFIMLNPSTADAAKDDPTIRRCIDFAKREGCGGLVVVNLFAWRATDPAVLGHIADPVGPDNIQVVLSVLCSDDISHVVAGWGVHPYVSRSGYGEIMERAAGAAGRELLSLGASQGGHPRHPLYVRKDALLLPYTYRKPRPA